VAGLCKKEQKNKKVDKGFWEVYQEIMEYIKVLEDGIITDVVWMKPAL
jgi:hypothetical protein